jgi:hypothetical protein
VLASAGAATALGALTVAGAASDANDVIVPVIAGWWVLAAAFGLWLGRHNTTNPPISRLLAEAKAATSLPEQRPSTVLLNRLWPLLLVTVLAGASAILVPQVPGIAAGFAIVWALAWRQQEKAVAAIEERDGVQFYVDRTSPLKPIKLVRAHGFRREAAPV